MVHSILNPKEAISWEQRKYEDIGTCFSGGALSYSSLSDNGQYNCILYGDLYTLYDTTILNVERRTDYKGNTVYQNDILFPQSTTVDAYSLISPACLNVKTAETSGVFVIRPNKSVDGNFIAYYSKGNEKQRNKLAKNAQGLTIVHIYYQSIKDETIKVPSLNEQIKIAALLMKLHSLITLHQREVLIWNK
ncbi:MAG: restriction endonuclease subunit S [Mollicutes bacterium]|nr:restriction endonuclease subunit S [Mollicutes bacterium]